MPTIVITGANRGLGLEFADQYAADGWTVIATCRRPATADKLNTVASTSGKIRIEKLDAEDAVSIAQFVAALRNVALDVVINNAGVLSGNPKASSVADGDTTQELGTIDADAWMKVLSTNTIAPIMVTQALLPLMTGKGQRTIVNITSKMGSISEMGSGYIAYRTSKSALNAAMATITHDLNEQGITIVNLHPGWVQTDMGGPSAPLLPKESVNGMRHTIARLTLKDSGRFLSYDGKTIPW
jgi:NAD(P)-dependent dehydrogenase (short-subunit alcohol dehydrogenase family)